MRMSTAVTAPEGEVDQAVGAVSTVFRQDKASVLQEHILDCLVTRHDLGREDLDKWALRVQEE